MRLHVVDGTYELFRAHYAPRPGHVAPDGSDAKATVGLVAQLLSLLRDPDEAVTHLAVAFDNPIRSFRNAALSTYKTEAGVEPGLLAQFDAVEHAVSALGVVVWSMDHYEADDALASATAQFRDHVEQVRILSPDKDLSQCIDGTAVVQVDRRRRIVIDEAALWATRGIRPRSIPDWLALVGDTADGIPGLRGFGAKSTSALLGRYPHLEDIPRFADAWGVEIRGAKRLAETLAAGLEQAMHYRDIATLAEDVPLQTELEALRYGGPTPAFSAWVRDIGNPRGFGDFGV